MQFLKSNRFAITISFFTVFLPLIALSQVPNHTYPRIAISQFAGAIPYWYSKFDLAMTRINDKEFAAKAKRLNPNLVWIPTEDFNCGHQIIPNTPNEWYAVDSKGNRLIIDYCGDGMADLSDLCPRVNGQRLIDAIPKYLAQIGTQAVFDGHATDGLWSTAHYSWHPWKDIDLDRNGVNDMEEHGKAWAVSHWSNGVEELLSNFRKELGDNKILLVNTGSGDTPGKSVANGYYWEYHGWPVAGDWNNSRVNWTNAFNQVRQPAIFIQQSNPDNQDPQAVHPTKNYLRFMRWSLVHAMLFGFYYQFEHVDNKSPDHWWNNYFDEFDLDLGHPAGKMQGVKDGLWARFFDGGVAIFAIGGKDVTVTDQELSALAGYSGPYYRFLGGQDMALNGRNAVNNGEKFTAATLHSYNYVGWNEATYTAGDGIILVRTKQAVVSDIIIDNVESGTSPVSEPAALAEGFIQGDKVDGRDYFTVRAGGVYAQPVFAMASPGAGNAIFTPNIGVSGSYEVFEWHGSFNDAQASNVTHSINHAGGKTTKAVNQRINAGQWNSLGTYIFNKGISGNVIITAQGADGKVMADAVRFVFRSNNSNRDTTAPAPPRNVKVQPGN